MLIKLRLNSTSTDLLYVLHQVLSIFSANINLVVLMSKCCVFLGVP